MSPQQSNHKLDLHGRVLVTGATGFLGQAVVEQLCQRGIPVRTTARSATAYRVLPDFHAIDLSRPFQTRRLLDGVTAIIHIAGLAHQFQREPLSEEFDRVNHQATKTLAKAAVQQGVKSFINISTVAVYQRQPCESTSRISSKSVPALTNEQGLLKPDSAYGRSKLLAEHAVEQIATSSKMKALSLRLCTLYGPGDPGNVSRLIRKLDRTYPILPGPLHNYKSLLFIEDAARACLSALEFLSESQSFLDTSASLHRAFNVAGDFVRMEQLVCLIRKELGHQTKTLRLPMIIPKLALEIGRSIPGTRARCQKLKGTLIKWQSNDAFDSQLFQQTTGWRPTVALRTGLRRTVESIQCRNSAAA